MLEAPAPLPCRHFARGRCLYGEKCKFVHTAVAAPAQLSEAVDEAEARQREEADAAFVACNKQVNALRKSGAPREEVLAAVRELDALKARRRALPAARSASRYQRRHRQQNAERAGVFRRWLCDMYGADLMRQGSGVLDVAGGQGSLAFELINIDEVPTTIIDPRSIERGFARCERKWRVLGGGIDDARPHAEDALTTAALAASDDVHTPSTPEARTRAARLVHRDWLLARERRQRCTRPGQWRLCWQPELYDVDLGASPSDATLSALDGSIEGLLERAQTLRWTRKGLVTAGSAEDEGDAEIDAEEAEEHALAAEQATDESSLASVSSALPSSLPTAYPPLSAAEAWRTLAGCSLVAGMHADGATEGIVDFGLKHDKPFAVVPCCVYSKEATETRRDATTGFRMSTMSYPAFIRYLVAKAPEQIRTATLPFEGKNIVVYRLPSRLGCGSSGYECEICVPV